MAAWTHSLAIALRIAWVTFGCVFLYMALFMYRDDMGELQNRFVELWVRVGEAEQYYLSKQMVFLQKTSKMWSSAITWLLGPRLLSIQTFIISASLALGSSLTLASVPYLGTSPKYSDPEIRVEVIVGLLFVAYAILFPRKLFDGTRGNIGAIVVFILFMFVQDTILTLPDARFRLVRATKLAFIDFPGTVTAAVGIALFGFVSNLSLFSIARAIARTMTTGNRVVVFAGLLYNVVFMIVFVDAVRYITHYGLDAQPHDPIFDPLFSLPIFQGFGGIGPFAFVAMCLSVNLVGIIFSCSLVIIATAAVLHWIFWPTLGRTINMLFEWKILSEKKVQLSLSIAFFSMSLPHWAERVRFWKDALGK